MNESRFVELQGHPVLVLSLAIAIMALGVFLPVVVAMGRRRKSKNMGEYLQRCNDSYAKK